MESVKSAFSWIGALLPVVYCAGLVYYFQSNFGGFAGANMLGLGPTMLGLGGVGLLFCIPLVLKLIRLMSGPPPAARRSGKVSAEAGEEAGSDFDADAALARYMARKAAGDVQPPPASAEAAAPVRASFGRKVA